MLDYLRTPGCRMEYLREQLDDPAAQPCGRCDNCTGHPWPAEVSEEGTALARARLLRPGVDISPRRMWPPGMKQLGVDVTGKIPAPSCRRTPAGRSAASPAWAGVPGCVSSSTRGRRSGARGPAPARLRRSPTGPSPMTWSPPWSRCWPRGTGSSARPAWSRCPAGPGPSSSPAWASGSLRSAGCRCWARSATTAPGRAASTPPAGTRPAVQQPAAAPGDLAGAAAPGAAGRARWPRSAARCWSSTTGSTAAGP